MKDPIAMAEVISTDVLVIGGGISGLLASIKAKETMKEVLVVDKGGIGWAGQVPFSGGDCALFRSEDAETHLRWLSRVGHGLNNRDWAYTVATDMFRCVKEVADMRLPFWTDRGELIAAPFGKSYRATHFSPATFMIKLQRVAARRGIKTLDKVFVTDLMKDGERVTGAVGFGLVDGKTYVLQARATVIANGSCRYFAQRNFSVNTGEGVAMAYRAGVELMNAEFANTYTYGFRGDIRRRVPLYLFFENVRGERFMEEYFPGLLTERGSGHEALDFYQIADAMTKEVEAGKGPIYIDFRKLSKEERALALQAEVLPVKFQPVGRGNLLEAIREKIGLDPETERIEVELQFCGGQGPIRIDPDCRTTVKGLWAVGDAGSLGSGYMGARASGTFGGFGIAFAMVSGLRGGSSAGRYAAGTDAVRIDEKELKRLRKRMLAPLGREDGLSLNRVIYEIHEAVIPVKYNLHREKSRLNEAVGKIEKARNDLPRTGVRDSHGLSRYHQAESMVLSAGWTLMSALLREESRGTHHRVDYPQRNDEEWLKWIVIKEEEGQSVYRTEAVPPELS